MNMKIKMKSDRSKTAIKQRKAEPKQKKHRHEKYVVIERNVLVTRRVTALEALLDRKLSQWHDDDWCESE